MQNGVTMCMGQYSFPHSSCIVSRKLLLLDITSLLADEYLRDQLRDLRFHDLQRQQISDADSNVAPLLTKKVLLWAEKLDAGQEAGPSALLL